MDAFPGYITLLWPFLTEGMHRPRRVRWHTAWSCARCQHLYTHRAEAALWEHRCCTTRPRKGSHVACCRRLAKALAFLRKSVHGRGCSTSQRPFLPAKHHRVMTQVPEEDGRDRMRFATMNIDKGHGSQGAGGCFNFSALRAGPALHPGGQRQCCVMAQGGCCVQGSGPSRHRRV